MAFAIGIGLTQAVFFVFDRKLDVFLNAMELSWD